MKRILFAVFATVIGLGMLTHEAEAKRFGGARSSGMSRDSSVMKRDAVPPKQAAPAAAPTAAAAAAKPAGMSRFLGPLAGLAAGIGLAALFSHLGMGEGMGNMLMMLALAAGAVFVVRWLMNRNQANKAGGLQYAGGALQPQVNRFEPTQTSTSFEASRVGAGNTVTPLAGAAASIPADFDVEGFLRQAKLNFVRLQAANDRGDMDDIRQFTSPELFAEVQMQYQERGKTKQQTDVVQLDAALLDVSQEANQHVASVRFSGQLKEEPTAPAEAFSEVWHLTKPNDGSRGWNVAGIQQA